MKKSLRSVHKTLPLNLEPARIRPLYKNNVSDYNVSIRND